MWKIQIKIIFICLRHGINPFSTIAKNANRMNKRFSEKEKQWFIDNANGRNKGYFKKLFTGDY